MGRKTSLREPHKMIGTMCAHRPYHFISLSIEATKAREEHLYRESTSDNFRLITALASS